MDKQVMEALDELKTKISGIDKIAELETVVIDDQRELAKTKKEMKEATDKLEASLDGLPEKMREEFKQHLETMPQAERQMETPANEWVDMSKMKSEDFQKMGDERPTLIQQEGQAFRKSFLSPAELKEKAINATSGVSGAGTTPATLWHDAIVGDPWITAGAFQMAPTHPNFQTVKVTNVQFAATTTVGATSFDAPTGTMATAVAHKCLTYTSRILVPLEVESDIMGTVAHIEDMVRLAYGKIRGSLTTTEVGADAKAGNTSTTNNNSGASKTEMVSLGFAMMGNVSDYWPAGCKWVLNSGDSLKLYDQLTGSSGLAMNPQSGLPRFAGYDIVIDHQAQTAAEKLINFFGCWRQALVQAQRGRLTMDRYMGTVPGAVALYSTFRFIPTVVNSDAYAAMKRKK